MRARLLNAAIALAVLVAFTLWALGLAGSVEIRAGEYWIGLSLAAAVVLLGLAVLLAHALLRLYAWALGAPERRRLRVALDNRALAELAVTRAMVALAAGHADTAQAELEEARRLGGETAPLLAMMAEVARARGDQGAAALAYEALAAREDSRFLGLHGLLRQAEARGDTEEAARLAREAARAEPRARTLRILGPDGRPQTNWREALALAGPEVPVAPLALAAAGQSDTEVEARGFERQAFQADPRFAPGVVAYAARLGGEAGRAVLQAGWEAAPHPEIAAAWLEGVTDPAERLRLVDELTRIHTFDPESRALRAEAALAAGDLSRARQDLEAWAAAVVPDRRWHRLMLALERAEQGDSYSWDMGAEWHRRAEAAPAPPGWACAACGTAHPSWMPECPSCGARAQIRWGAAIPA